MGVNERIENLRRRTSEINSQHSNTANAYAPYNYTSVTETVYEEPENSEVTTVKNGVKVFVPKDAAVRYEATRESTTLFIKRNHVDGLESETKYAFDNSEYFGDVDHTSIDARREGNFVTITFKTGDRIEGVVR